ncbi:MULTISPECIES: serine protein kinase [unclassified Janthinobacterium]|uniref:serine protein kinase n=1 Tax=unclassified Janthinobacterium TaxID=2610881 RepID=UPI0017FCDE5E|nr:MULTISPECIES: serine protein kinase [unclassified Janthinobacterium]MBB5369801.1 serine protein kinase [Janthinobacterium sp. K2C7]MBB5382607.1 serine protein kinase [Janthinobacterium sp. K2Li3]MBB5384592.1 serine protein kinase [Janthinobacterium sp. K2E3]
MTTFRTTAKTTNATANGDATVDHVADGYADGAAIDETSQRAHLMRRMEAFTAEHRVDRWDGTFSDFVTHILPGSAAQLARNAHQYLWDMMRWSGHADSGGHFRCRLFDDELFGIDEAIDRVAAYFKAAAAGSEVGRRMLLLLGPPSGGKSTLVILLKRGLEEYSRTQEGAVYGIAGCPVHESPLHLVPQTMRAAFRDGYGADIQGELCPHCRARLEEQHHGDFLRMPVERIMISEAGRCGVGTYAPHDPSTADLADLVGSIDLSKVAQYGDEGDPRAWSWSGAVYAASRGMLEMIEILKVKREFLYLLLTLTQEKNVKVSRFPLIYLDECILAHTNLAEFRKFLQESENEALLDRMVIVQVPYTLNYREEARIYRKLILSAAPAFRNVHLDPHVLHAAAVFAILSRMQEGEDKESELVKKLRIYADEEVEDLNQAEVRRLRDRDKAPEEGLAGVSPRFVINALSHAIISAQRNSLSTMDVLLALKDSIENDARIEPRRKRKWIDYLVLTRKDFYNRWVKADVHKALFVSFEQEAQDLLNKYLDEVEAMLDNRQLRDPITNEERRPDERFLRAVEEKIHITDSGKQSFRQEVVRKAMGAFKRGEPFGLGSHVQLHDAVQQYLFEQRRDVLRLVSSAKRPDDDVRTKISAVEQRLVDEYGYDAHSAREALNYVTTLLAQE